MTQLTEERIIVTSSVQLARIEVGMAEILKRTENMVHAANAMLEASEKTEEICASLALIVNRIDRREAKLKPIWRSLMEKIKK